MNKLGSMLRQERKERGLTLGDMARRLGLSVPYLSQIETGARPPLCDLVERLIVNFELIGEQANAWRRAAALAATEYAIRLEEGANDDTRLLAATLAAGFARLSAEKREALRRIMEDEHRG